MAKIALNNVTSPQNVSVMNDNFQKIMVALDEQVLYRDNPEGEPNQMENDLDMNGKRIYNLPVPIADSEPMRRQDAALIVNEVSGDLVAVAEAATVAANAATAAAIEATEAAEDASETAQSALDLIEGVTATITALPTASGSSLVGFIQAGTGAILRTVQSKLRERVSVKDYGAVGDGITNDGPAIQLACNAAVGKLLYFPPGEYLAIDGFGITGDDTHILGEGATILYPATSEGYYHCIRVFGNDCSVRDIKIQSPPGLVRGDSGFGISGGQADTLTNGLVIDNVQIDGVGSAGMWFSNVRNVIVTNCKVTNCKADGIHFSDGCQDIIADSNHLFSNEDDNIAFVNDTTGSPYVTRFLASNNNIVGTGATRAGFGIVMIGASSGVCVGNHIAATGGAALGSYAWTDPYPGDYIYMVGNQITNTGGYGTQFGGIGILVLQGANVSITSNNIAALQYIGGRINAGVYVADSTGLFITDNIFNNLACDAITVLDASIATICSNHFGYLAREGIAVSQTVTKAIVNYNTFGATDGATEININLPSGTAIVQGNHCTKAVTVVAAVSNIHRMEHQTATSAVTASAGTITTATAGWTYQRQGKFIPVVLAVGITTNGTGSGVVRVAMPFTGVTSAVLNGKEYSVSNKGVVGILVGGVLEIATTEALYPGGNGTNMVLSGYLLT